MAILEEHIIKIKHVSDAEGMQRARDQARKVAREIEQAFDKAADGGGASAEELAGAQEKAAKRTSEVWTGALRRVGARLTDFGIGAAKALASYAAETFESVRETDLFAQTLGVATSEMQALEKGFERARVPAENTREAVKTLRENLGELDRLGTGPARDALGSLGLALDDLKGKTPTEQIEILADALRNVEDPMKRTSIAIELMGEDGQRIMPAMLEGADGVREFTRAARDAGQVLDDETIQASRDLDEAIMDAKASAEGIALSIMTKALPAFQRVAKGTAGWVEENQDFIDQDLPSLLDSMVTALQAVGRAVQGAAEGFVAAKEAASDFASGWSDWELGVKLRFATDPRTGEYISEETAAASQRTVSQRGVAGIAGAQGAAGRVRLRDQESRREAQAYQDAERQRFVEDQKRQAAERAALERRDKARAFETGEKKPKGGRKGGGGRSSRQRGPSAEALAQAEQLREELARIGGRFGATDQGIENAVQDAAKQFDRGGNIAAARKAALGTIGRLTDTRNIEKQISQDPLSKLLGVEALPDVSPAEIAQDRAPQVLTATINNTFTIDLNFDVDGAARPDLIPDQVLDAFRSMFANEVQSQTKYVKVPFAR